MKKFGNFEDNQLKALLPPEDTYEQRYLEMIAHLIFFLGSLANTWKKNLRLIASPARSEVLVQPTT